MAWDLGRKHDSPIIDGAEGGAGGSMSDLLCTNIHSHLDKSVVRGRGVGVDRQRLAPTSSTAPMPRMWRVVSGRSVGSISAGEWRGIGPNKGHSHQ